jgi:diguanylate cyclase (GGDEF)-like protein/PAS domain S-box-containing protein
MEKVLLWAIGSLYKIAIEARTEAILAIICAIKHATKFTETNAMMKIGLGQAEGLDAARTVENAIHQCKRGLDGLKPQAGIVYCGSEVDHKRMLEAIRSGFPGMALIGCTTAGEFSSGYGVSDDSIALMAIHSDAIEMGVGVGRNLSGDPEAAVREAVRRARGRLSKPEVLCLTMPDLFDKSPNRVMRALSRELSKACGVFGGCAARHQSDGLRILGFCNDEVLEDAIPVLLFGRGVKYGFVISVSWKPVGKRAEVVKANGRKVLTIGSLRALDFYRYYLGHHTEPASAFPLAVYEDGQEQFYLREPIHYDEEDGAITFSGAIPEGCTVQITEALRDAVIDDTKKAVEPLREFGQKMAPRFALAFSCVLRKETMGTRAREEMDIVLEALSPGAPFMGFYGNGEIGPHVGGGECFFHNAALITLLVGEALGDEAQKDASGSESPEAAQGAEASHAAAEASPDPDELQQECAFLNKKLARSEDYRRRLESVKDLHASLYLTLVQEVEAAREEIEQKEQALRNSEVRYRRIVETAAEGFIMLDQEFHVIDANDAYCRMIGYTREELAGRLLLDLATDEYREYVMANKDALCMQDYRRIEGELIARDGRRIPILIHGSSMRNAAGEIVGHVGFVTDLTELKSLQRELEISERNYRGMYENAVQGIFQATTSGKALGVNPACTRILGFDSPAEFMESDGASLDAHFEAGDWDKMVQALKAKGYLTNYELKLKRKDGSPVWVLVNMRLIDAGDREAIFEGMVADNTARKRAEDELRKSREMFRHMAIHDSLTGLYNTRHLYRALEDLILESKAGEAPFSLIFMDMDNFKRVVDSYGHLNGSQALKEVAATIRSCLAEPAFGVAYGGDEFVAALPGFGKSEAQEKAEEIRAAMKATSYLASQGHSVSLRASFGIATFPDDATDIAGLLALADQAMFHVKERGKDAVGWKPAHAPESCFADFS